MEIIFQGQYETENLVMRLERALNFLKERYHIEGMREIHLSLTLMDKAGCDIELFDTSTNQPYRVLEICPDHVKTTRSVGRPRLTLVVNDEHI